MHQNERMVPERYYSLPWIFTLILNLSISLHRLQYDWSTGSVPSSYHGIIVPTQAMGFESMDRLLF